LKHCPHIFKSEYQVDGHGTTVRSKASDSVQKAVLRWPRNAVARMVPVKAISHQLDSHIDTCSESILPNLGHTKFDELENVGFILKR
jgi:hypothetical protein